MTTCEDPISDAKFDRYLIRGELRERAKQFRGRVEAVSLGHAMVILGRWQEAQPSPGGEVLIDLGFRLGRQPRTAVDIPIAIISAETADANSGDVTWIDGRPELAVEFVNYRETLAAIRERMDDYLACGVRLVWLIDPSSRTIEVRRPSPVVELLDFRQAITDVPELPGFSCRVADFFR
jgi:Uma2 family endonuclease